ncbi:Plant lectins/antimicrobial peptide [Glarea lozoyensis ATCC 20868]|uniref:Plant lectins/antimicrobial peptide n=1 Tax=Glarea lozoyensis (strain ATCC 20868 / MF5171) TaxID=1116229 RepID=S3D1W6_GLAL2|nr:Plant lectins/antimicrobial peptide [Glarea lozoyensis ATCC 20868]EPE32552.1 Plant lectins/antimicrobial peptide [Glarea lozoyensis ATCC 20868]
MLWYTHPLFVLLTGLRLVCAASNFQCRYNGTTPATVNYYTCTEIANKYDIKLASLFELNPSLKPDCSNIAPNTNYCVAGGVALVLSKDGFCGPQHANTTCKDYSGGQCCNSQTWKCGDATADCQAGTCFEGSCVGFPSTYSLDGNCGTTHGNLLCGGTWGDCCNKAGKCGKGSGFCDKSSCQSGLCEQPVVTLPPMTVPWATGNTTDGKCGGTKKYTCNVLYETAATKMEFVVLELPIAERAVKLLLAYVRILLHLVRQAKYRLMVAVVVLAPMFAKVQHSVTVVALRDFVDLPQLTVPLDMGVAEGPRSTNAKGLILETAVVLLDFVGLILPTVARAASHRSEHVQRLTSRRMGVVVALTSMFAKDLPLGIVAVPLGFVVLPLATVERDVNLPLELASAAIFLQMAAAEGRISIHVPVPRSGIAARPLISAARQLHIAELAAN